MASNHTANYNLSQWEENDEVLRADFNADNAKIEAALTALAPAYTPGNKPYVTGTYTGDGAESKVISLGFTPSAVVVFQYDGATYNMNNGHSFYYGGLALPGYNASQSYSELTTWKQGSTLLEICEGGFRVAYDSGRIFLNDTHCHYYIAFR